MVVGAWLSWIWFAINGQAIGSPNRNREALLVLGGFLGSAVIILILGSLRVANVLGEGAMPYAYLALVAWKLGVSYSLYIMQNRNFELYAHFGGIVRNGFFILIAGALLSRQLLRLIGEIPMLGLVLR